MTYYELKKVLVKPSTRVLGVVLVVVTLVVIALSVSTVEWVNDDGNVIKGLSAISKIRDEKEKWSGKVTKDYVANIIAKNTEYNNSVSADIKDAENIIYAKKQGFKDIREMINYSFSEFRDFDYYKIDELTEEDANKFYNNRIDNLKTWLDNEGSQLYNKVEKQYYIEQYEKLEIPINYEYSDGWKNLNNNASIVIMTSAIVICLIVSNVFSSEKQYREDYIFYSTYRGRNRGIVAKIKAGTILTTIIYILALLIFTLVTLAIFGSGGADCAIQASGLWKSFYNLTNLHEYLLIFIGGYVATLYLSMLTMFISALTTSAIFSSVISFIVILLPSIIMTLPLRQTTISAIGILPDQLLNVNNILRQFNVYCIGNFVILPITIMLCLYFLLTVVLIPLTYWSFKIKEVK